MYTVYRCWETSRVTLLNGIRSLEEACHIARTLQKAAVNSGVRYLVFGPAAVPGKRGSAWFDPRTRSELHAPIAADPASGQQETSQHPERTYANDGNVENKTSLRNVSIPGHRPEGTNTTHILDAGATSSHASTSSDLVAQGRCYRVMRHSRGDTSVIETDIATLREAKRIVGLAQKHDPDKQVKYYILAPPRFKATKWRAAATASTSNMTSESTDDTHASAQQTLSPTRKEAKPTPVSRAPLPTPSSSAPSTQSKQERPTPEQPCTTQQSGVRCYIVRVQGQTRETIQGEFASLESARAHANVLAKRTTDPSITYDIAYSTETPQSSLGFKGRNVHSKASDVLRQPYDPATLPARKQRRERRKHDWEVEDRAGDVSLVVREDDEVGLGIPAQWGKGKRNRKGHYVP